MKKTFLISLTFAFLLLLGSVAFFSYQKYQKNLHPSSLAPENQNSSTPTSTPASVISTTTTPENKKNTSTSTDIISHPGMKLYRNEQWGFEFWYPEGWEWYEDPLRNPSITLQLILIRVGGENTSQDTVINVVTQSFFENYLVSMERLNAKKSEIIVDNRLAVRYRYDFEGTQTSDVIFPLKEFQLIFGTKTQHEKEFNQILSSFKFLK